MTKLAVVLTGVLAVTVTAAVLLVPFRDRKAPVEPENSSPAPGKSAATAPGAESPDRVMSRLLLERTPMARLELVNLYAAWSRDPGRRHDRLVMVREIVSREEPLVAINMVTSAVAGDPTPLEQDELLPEISRLVAPLWKDQAMMMKGRDLLRLAENDKAKALLAASLTERIDHPPGGSPEIPARERQELASDLIQTHMHSGNRALKAQTLANVRTVAGPNVAEVLADPANAPRSMAARKAEEARRQAAALVRADRRP